MGKRREDCSLLLGRRVHGEWMAPPSRRASLAPPDSVSGRGEDPGIVEQVRYRQNRRRREQELEVGASATARGIPRQVPREAVGVVVERVQDRRLLALAAVPPKKVRAAQKGQRGMRSAPVEAHRLYLKALGAT